ncbi:hypothetical protein CP10743SC13_1962, partial [Chlamydia psittaci 10_743_SC13]
TFKRKSRVFSNPTFMRKSRVFSLRIQHLTQNDAYSLCKSPI